jgi:hypothetical protein
MEQSLSTFDSNHAIFMQRFPKLGLLLGNRSCVPPVEEELFLPDLKEIDLLYVYGVGRGGCYWKVRSWLHEKKKRRLVFLGDEFAPLLECSESSEILSDSQVLFGMVSDISLLTQQLPVAKVEVICLPSMKNKGFQTLRLEILRKTTLSFALYMDRLYGYERFANFLQNVRRLPTSFYANGLKGKFANIPAIVCGAGPSLERAIASLKKMENQALIIAGGSTLAALSSAGVMPHFGMAVDPNLEELKRLKNSFAFEVPLIYSTRLISEAFYTCNGPFGYLRSGIGGLLELWIEEVLGLSDPLLGEHLSDESISVTTICLAWAEFLGCNPILLSGVDLAYTDNKHYAKGVDEDTLLTETSLQPSGASDRIIRRKDRLGNPIMTAVRWVMESASISHFVKQCRSTEFVNTTEGGLEIKGLAFSSIQAYEDRFPNLDLKARVCEAIFNSPMPPHSAEIIQSQITKLLASLDRLVEHLKVLAQKESPLDELELEEEIAYTYLFYDFGLLLHQEIEGAKTPREKWGRFLDLAIKYQQSARIANF